MMKMKTLAALFLAGLVVAPACGNTAQESTAQSNHTPAEAISSSASAPATVGVLHAGSLTGLIEDGLAPVAKETDDLTVNNTAGNSVAVANSIKDGSLMGDVYMSAGAGVNETLIGETNADWVSWFLVFASNEVVVAYSPQSKFADQFEQARNGEIPWYQVLEQPGVRFGRDDPNLDPLGYYGVFIGQLAEKHYQQPGLKDRIFGDDNNPEQVIKPDFPLLKNGQLDAIFAYRTGAQEAEVPYVTLPDEINLSNPDFDDQYITASYTTDKGQVFHGSTIRYTVAPLRDGDEKSAFRFINLLISNQGEQITKEASFLPHPIWAGGDTDALPDEFKNQIEGTYEFP